MINATGNRKVALVVGLCLFGQLVLHLAYGEETFLYSLHWCPLLVIVAAFSVRTPLGDLARVLALGVVVGFASNNVKAFVHTVPQLAGRPPEVRPPGLSGHEADAKTSEPGRPTPGPSADNSWGAHWDRLRQERDDYRRQLGVVRREHGGTCVLPPVTFFRFGMGGRRKFLYRDGTLRDARTGVVVRGWDVKEELIVPPAYKHFR